MLQLENITKVFGEKTVLDGISLSVGKGEAVSLFGLSGSGKTTLLRIAAGLETPDGGMVRKEGRIAVVFAEPRLFPFVNALENVTAVQGGNRRESEEKARRILSALGLTGAETLYPAELSTGMAARVALARAIAFDGDIYLLDEPFSGLDGEIKTVVMDYLKAFLASKTAILISHDEGERASMGFPQFRLEKGLLKAAD